MRPRLISRKPLFKALHLKNPRKTTFSVAFLYFKKKCDTFDFKIEIEKFIIDLREINKKF